MKLLSKISATAFLIIALSAFLWAAAQQKSAVEKSLNPKQLSLTTIAAYTTKGDLAKLKNRDQLGS